MSARAATPALSISHPLSVQPQLDISPTGCKIRSSPVFAVPIHIHSSNQRPLYPFLLLDYTYRGKRSYKSPCHRSLDSSISKVGV